MSRTRSWTPWLRRRVLLSRAVLFLVAVVLGGCGSGGSDAKAIVKQFNDMNGKRLANLYAQYQAEYMVGPASEKVLKKYITAKPAAALEEMGVSSADIDNLFVSERDNQPFYIRYAAPCAPGGSQAVVFETQGSGGNIAVFYTGPRVVQVSAADVDAYKRGDKDAVAE